MHETPQTLLDAFGRKMRVGDTVLYIKHDEHDDELFLLVGTDGPDVVCKNNRHEVVCPPYCLALMNESTLQLYHNNRQFGAGTG